MSTNKPVQLVRGSAYIIAASLMFAVAGACVKLVSSEVPNEVLVFLRNLFSFILLLPWLLYKGVGSLRTQRLSLHLVRSVSALLSIYLYFFAISGLHLADAVLLNFTAPIFLPIFALLLYRIPIRRDVAIAVVIGFLGVTLILKPGFGVLSLAGVSGLAAGACGGLAVAAIWRMSDTEPAMRMVVYFTVISLLASVIPLSWAWQLPEPPDLLAIVALGAAATLAHIFLAIGYTRAPADSLCPWEYTTIVFAALIGWFAWNEGVDLVMVLGGVLVAFSGVTATRWRLHSPSVPDDSPLQ